MRLIKIQKDGNAGIQCMRFYMSFGVSKEAWRLLKSGEVIEIPFDTSISLRGVIHIGNPYDKKEEVVEEKNKTKKSKKSEE